MQAPDMLEPVRLSLSDITVETMAALRPCTVVVPLVCFSFDCTDVAQRLTESEFAGTVRVVGPALPRPDVVLAELRASFPLLDIELVTAPELKASA